MVPQTYCPEPRCHVCQNEAIRVQVNEMLAWGWSYTPIVRAVAADGHRVSLDSVRNHAKRHFPEQNVATALYREMVERRADQGEIDYENGAGTAITPLAYLEAMMVKGWQSLVRDDTEVSPEMGLRAAEKLYKAVGVVDPLAEKAKILAEMNRVIAVVKAVLPEPLWPELQAGLRELDSLRIDLPEAETVEPQEPRGPDEVIVVPIDPGEGDDDF
jgi:hypothetical protein